MESKWKKISFILIIAIAVLAGFYRFEMEQAQEFSDLYDSKSQQLTNKEAELQQTINRLRLEEERAGLAEQIAQITRAECEDLRLKLSKK